MKQIKNIVYILLGFFIVLASCKNNTKKLVIQNKPIQEATPSPTPTKYKVTFEVEGKSGGSLKAQLKDATETFTSSPQDVESGKTVLFTATPAPEDYEIEKWTKDGTEVNEKKPTYELKIEANVTVKVKFKKKNTPPPEPPVIEGDKATYTIKDVKFVMKKVDSVSQASLGFGTGKHTANLSTYWVAETEVTQELWDEVMKGNPSWFDGTGLKTHSSGSVINTNPKDDDNQMKRPVDSVNWYDCIVFCNELTKRCMSENDCVYYSDEAWTKIYTKDDAENKLIPYMYKIGEDATNISKEMNKKGFRLPTNDEWEWAAQAKAHSSYAGTEDIELLHKYAWFKQDNDNSKWVTREVKKLFPNAFGLYDMNGNVMEWCWDGFSNITGDAGENPITKGKDKVLKGGSYFTSKTIMSFSCTLDQRMKLKPDTKISLTQCGMRLACFD